MSPKVQSAVTEFNKWFTQIGILFIIGLQLSILNKVEAVTILANEHGIEIKYAKNDIRELQLRVDALFIEPKVRSRFKQTDEQPQ